MAGRAQELADIDYDKAVMASQPGVISWDPAQFAKKPAPAPPANDPAQDSEQEPEPEPDQHLPLCADIAGLYPPDNPRFRPKRRLNLVAVPGEHLMIGLLRSRLRALGRGDDLVLLPLNVGDVGFCYDGMPDEMVKLVIELKKCTDLSASIGGRGQHGNRWKEQFVRMLHAGLEPHNIVYMIYGSVIDKPGDRHAVPFKSRIGALVKRTLRDGVPTVLGYDVEYVADMIIFYLYYLEHLDESEFEARNYRYEVDGMHVDSKKSAVQGEHKMVRLLMNVPGMSAKRAAVIAEHYRELPDLVRAWATAPDPRLLLSEYTVAGETGKERRIGPELSKAVCAYFGGESYADMFFKPKEKKPSRKDVPGADADDAGDDDDDDEDNEYELGSFLVDDVDESPRRKKRSKKAPQKKQRPRKRSRFVDDMAGVD